MANCRLTLWQVGAVWQFAGHKDVGNPAASGAAIVQVLHLCQPTLVASDPCGSLNCTLLQSKGSILPNTNISVQGYRFMSLNNVIEHRTPKKHKRTRGRSKALPISLQSEITPFRDIRDGGGGGVLVPKSADIHIYQLLMLEVKVLDTSVCWPPGCSL